jgi:hypothetical protein
MNSWSSQLDNFLKVLPSDHRLAEARARLLAEAHKILELPLFRRMVRYEDMGKHRSWLDGRAVPLQDPTRTIFAQAMSDHAACNTLSSELPLLATAWRLSREESFRLRLIEQLTEMSTWSPLQRPGWTLFQGGTLPPDGKDGNWLATGTGIRALADTFEVLGPEFLPNELKIKFDHLLAAEIADIVEDWKVKRTWFIHYNNTITNQWVLPTEGLIRACLMLGRQNHLQAYELGVENLMASLDSHSPSGAFEEGIHYAEFTARSLYSAARAMAMDGDDRALSHPFLQNYPVWHIHHAQPGGSYINCFDAFSAARGNKQLLSPLLSLAAICTRHPATRWAFKNLVPPATDLPGLLTYLLPPAQPEDVPPLFAMYERACRVNWRNSWEPDASGVWIRGGHPTDQHDHQDRGHINFIIRGRPILIEAGTPAYHNPRLSTHYASGLGHNVLQLGVALPSAEARSRELPPGWQKIKTTAPLTVHNLTSSGGSIEVDGSQAYDHLTRWIRKVQWTDRSLTAEDEVVLESGYPDIVLFRWHLGTEESVSIPTQTGLSLTAQWPDAQLTLSANVPLILSQESLPDNTLDYRDWDSPLPEHLHTCLVMRTVSPETRVCITTSVKGTAPV